jgi:hypothetical protein
MIEKKPQKVIFCRHFQFRAFTETVSRGFDFGFRVARYFLAQDGKKLPNDH